MSDIKLSISVLANAQEVEAFRKSSQGGIRLPVGTILASVCHDGRDCGVDTFWDIEDLKTWICNEVEPQLKKSLKRKA